MCKALTEIEKRFSEISGINCDFTVFPLPEDKGGQASTDKGKSDTFGEVFTPLWFVDKMILKLSSDSIAVGRKLWLANTPLDLCAGYGQFTVRMLRCIANYRRSQKKSFDVYKWLKKHSFSELQFESVYKLLYIFGTRTNIYIGDSSFLNSLTDKDNGILIHDWKGWVNITKEVRKKFGEIEYYNKAEEIEFCKLMAGIIKRRDSIQLRLF